MSQTTRRKEHVNDERTVKCPVESCNAEPLARGAHLHVLRSVGEGHGEQGEIPEGINMDNLETVGAESVTVEYPEEREHETVARLCPYCKRPFVGEHGINVHFGSVRGKKNHPTEYPDIDPTELPAVKLDSDENIVEVLHSGKSFADQLEEGAAMNLAEHLRDEGNDDAAQQVEEILLG